MAGCAPILLFAFVVLVAIVHETFSENGHLICTLESSIDGNFSFETKPNVDDFKIVLFFEDDEENRKSEPPSNNTFFVALRLMWRIYNGN